MTARSDGAEAADLISAAKPGENAFAARPTSPRLEVGERGHEPGPRSAVPGSGQMGVRGRRERVRPEQLQRAEPGRD